MAKFYSGNETKSGVFYHIIQKAVCREVALRYDTLFLGGEKSGMKATLLYKGINTKMDSTVMRYDQQHKVGAQTKNINLLGRGGFTHLRERDNNTHKQ